MYRENCFIDISNNPHKLYLFDPYFKSDNDGSSIIKFNELKKRLVNK